MMAESDLTGQLQKMQREWDERARENARFYVNTERQDWTDADFFRSGEGTVAEEILTDMINICQGQDPKQMTVLEIGCGAGRVTRALAQVFGQVYGVDISGEMVRQARAALADLPHVHVFQNNGKDLSVLGAARFDFAFSSIVFQHIPSRDVIESYIREVHARLRRGRLFKFQVQGAATPDAAPDDTWLGATVSEQDARDIAVRCGFEMRHQYGAGGQYFWLWFFKRPFPLDWWYRGKYALLAAYRRGHGRLSRTLHQLKR
jgi:SAM-dependent methyltransferase